MDIIGMTMERIHSILKRYRMAAPSERRKHKAAGEKTFTLACVVDRNTRFHVELVLWITAAKKNLPSSRFKLIVYHLGLPADIIEYVADREVEMRRIPGPIVEGHRHCNKIYPFLDDHRTDYTVVSDTDVYFLEDPSGFFSSDRLRAPPNNHSVPSPDVFKTVLAASGMTREYRPGLALFPGGHGSRETMLNNISAGVVGLPSHCRKRFALSWIEWAKWLVAHRQMLREGAGHVDQMAFALACEELREDVEHLPPQLNTILHLIEEVSTVYAFHLSTGHIPEFPSRFNLDRTLGKEGLSAGAAQAVDRLNLCIGEAVDDIAALPSLHGCMEKFLNPGYDRSGDVPADTES